MTNDDELLDQVIAHLRAEPVPAMPDWQPLRRPSHFGRRRWGVGLGAALAASLLAWLAWRSQDSAPPLTQSPAIVHSAPVSEPTPTKPPIEQLDIDLTRPYQELETALDDLEAEISKVRHQAALEQARRQVAELLAQF